MRGRLNASLAARGVLAPIVIAGWMLAGASADPLHEKIIRHQQQVHQTNVQIQSKRGELDNARQRSEELRSELSQTYGNIQQTNAQIERLERDVRWNQRRLAGNRRQLDAARASLRRYDDALKRRLVDAYEHGSIGYINVLLSSTSFSDFVERWDDIRLLIASNQRAVHARQEAERRVARAQSRIEAQQVALDTVNTQEDQARARQTARAQEKHNQQAGADQQKPIPASQVMQLEEVSAQEQAELTALIQQRQREEEAIREARRRAALLSGQQLPRSYGEAPRRMQWPASGPITSPFGLRPDPFNGSIRLHPGVDIGVGTGTTISAAATGKVIVVETGYSGGYGNHVVIDHGGGIATLYGHLSQIFVSEGQEVRQGQAIGASGSTGYSTGPHLHFEVRVNGSPVDPLGWLH